jgi:hypothetical protein
MTAFDHGFSEIELPVKFKCPRLDRKGPRGGARIGRLVDYAHLDAELSEPERQD